MTNLLYPFGMLQPGRTYSAGTGYRYGFNGKERDKDIAADNYDFGARIYDGRIGRFVSLDPKQKKYPNETHYAFVSNSPLLFADLDGKDKIITITIIDKDGKSSTATTVIKDRYINYTHIDKPGFGNDIWVRYDVIETVVIDYSKPKYAFTYTVREGDRHEISAATYKWHKINEYFNSENNRSVQGGGFTLTSEFSSNGDGAKADAKNGSSGLWYVDGFNAASTALSKSPEYAADLNELIVDVMSKANELTEKILEDREKKELEPAKKRWYEPISPSHPSSTSTNDKPKPTDNTTPRIEPGRKTYSGPPDLKSKVPSILPGGADSLMTKEQSMKEWNKYYKRMGQKCKVKIGKNGNIETVCQ